MLQKLSLLPILTLFLFFGCSKEDIDETKGKKKKEEEFNPAVNYVVCVAFLQACIDAEGNGCFIVKTDPQYFDNGGGGVEALCLDRTIETYLANETGGGM
ncbi:hypothetical protein [Leptospira haakeii]|uniref:Lipoprotein n=1 Tax=Leptospira haakeii TaxID=2023198 RepID=A0ABX4PL63_9LEPT|nr:hypothetical protein [Leptospira haakeii]PKA16505.1 hypothetical protein CH363_06910 [Leptospira haakeii]PKA20526.1 hypothetical protein CH377_06315 [Leptospira haakeii]